MTIISWNIATIEFSYHSFLVEVVYHNDLTDAFFDCVYQIMSSPPNKTLLVALEKR